MNRKPSGGNRYRAQETNGTIPSALSSLESFRAWVLAAPHGTQIPASAVERVLETLDQTSRAPAAVWDEDQAEDELTWRERLWTVPEETRLGSAELAEALGRPKSWIYARTKRKAERPLPHAKLDGALVFRAGEIRGWLQRNEEVVRSWPGNARRYKPRLLEE